MNRSGRKADHKKKACAEVGIKPRFDEHGVLLTTWGEINKALRGEK